MSTLQTATSSRSGTFVFQVLAVFLPMALLTCGAAYYFYYTAQDRADLRNRARESSTIELGRSALGNVLLGIRRDLRLVSEHYALKNFLDQPVPTEIRDFEQDMLNLSSASRWYDQIRWLDETGMERVRINFNNGNPVIVPVEALQNKRARYYFPAVFKLARGEVYISPLDLNIEHERIEIPYKPMLRIGTPVFNSHGDKRGIVLLNYLGDELLVRFDKVTADIADHVMLLNQDGYWLKSPRPDEAWGFMFGRDQITLAWRHPAAWQRILAADSGQFEDAEGLWTFKTIYPGLEGQQTPDRASFWKVVAHLPPHAFYGSQPLFKPLLAALAGLLLLQFVGSWKLVHVRRLRNEAQDQVWHINRNLERLVEERTAQLQADINLRKQVEEHLHLQSAALEAAANAIVITDTEGFIQWANPAYFRLTGYTVEESRGKRPKDLIKSGLQDQAFWATFWRTIKSGQVWRGEVINKRKDGVLYTEEMTVTPVRDERGELAHFIAVKEDIAERKRLEQRQLAQFRLLKKATGDMPLTALLEELIRFIEEQAPKLRCAILLADNTLGVLRHGAAPSLSDAYNRLVEGLPIAEGCGSCGTACARRETVIVSDIRSDPLWSSYLHLLGDMDWLHACWSTPFFDSRSQLLGTFGVYADESRTPDSAESELIAYAVALASLVVERKQANESLRQSENKLATILDSVEAFIYIKDTALHYQYANRHVCELFGKPLEDVVDQGDEAFFDAVTATNLRENDRRVLEHGERIETEEVNTDKESGQTRTYLSVKLPLKDEEGAIHALCGISTDITERKRAEEALRESEEKLHLFIEHAPAALAMFDREMCYLAVSRRWMTDYGLDDGGDVIGRSHYEVFPEIPEHWKTVHRQGLSGEVVKADDESFERFDGSVQWLRWEVRPWYTMSGIVGGIVIFTEDITERKRAEDALRASEARFRNLFEQASDGIFLISADNRYLEANACGQEMLGYTREELLRRGVADVLALHERPRLDIEPVLMMAGQLHLAEWEHLRKNSSTFPAEVSARKLDDRSYLAIVRDLTERKKIEEELRQASEQIQGVFAAATEVAIVAAAPDGMITVFNSGAEHLLGYNAEEMIGHRTPAIFHLTSEIEAREAELSREYGRAIQGFDVFVEEARHGCHQPREWTYIRKDGTHLTMSLVITAMRDKLGNIDGFLGIANDITKRKQAELHLLNLNRVYTVLSNINQAIVRLRDMDTLFREACRIAVEDGGFRMAWIGLPDTDGRELRPVANFGLTQDYLDSIHISLGSGEHGRGPTGTAFHEGRHVCCNDIEHDPCMGPWRQRALQLGYRASIAMPIKIKGVVRGVYNLYASQADFFTCEEIKLLEELAGDLGFAMEVAEAEVERLRADERLRQAAAMFESTHEGMMVTDADLHILMVNRAFSEITGYTETEVLGAKPSVLRSGRHDRDFYAAQWTSLNATGHWQGEIWNRRKNGELYPELLSISAVKDEIGQVSGYVGVFADITKLKSSEADLEFLAHHDPLTRLPNRLLLLSRLDHSIEMARREDDRQLALLMLDLDRFKDINDSFGHPTGDDLLHQVAARLTARLRGVDTITRLGGDEFTVLLEDIAHPEDAARVADEIIAALSEPWQLANGIEVRISVSIGISLFPQHGGSAAEMLQQADAALYQAKAEGRGRFTYFSENLTRAARERIGLEARLRRGIARNELRVYYQPQVDIASGRITGAEALVRWQDPLEGLIPPSRFIPVAEATGLICAVGEWVLKETCLQGRRWLEMGLPPLTLAVNVSPHQFLSGDLVAVVSRTLAATGFPAASLELELTESALMERQQEAVDTLSRLRATGVRFAIDDFGTGYSSLAYLKRFPLDVLKIDKSFVDDIPGSEDDKEIAAAIVVMAHTLRFKVLAEGVETVEQLTFLQGQGCDSYQGYLKSPPLPPDAFAKLLAESRLE